MNEKESEGKRKVFDKVLNLMLITSSSKKSLLTHLKENFDERLNEILYDIGSTPAPHHQPFCYPKEQVELILDSVPSIFPYNFKFDKITEEQEKRLLEIANLGTSKCILRSEVASIIGKTMPYLVEAYH